MARDYLAIPATSSPVERAFSKGRDLVSFRRNALNAETIRACMCLKYWWKNNGNNNNQSIENHNGVNSNGIPENGDKNDDGNDGHDQSNND